MKNILVTGASGFLGSHIVDACLEKGYHVKVIIRPSSDRSYLDSLGEKVKVLAGDFTNEDFLKEAVDDVDCIIHSAARVTDVGHWDLFYEANVGITDRLLACAAQGQVSRFVFVSSPSVVAEQKDQINIDESYPFPAQFLNYYCETKAIAEQHVLTASTESLVTCAIRPRAVWGPRDVAGPFAKFMKKLQQEKLKDLSNGREVMSSICYVRNAADACVKAMTAQNVSGKSYFVTDNETVDLWKFADQMAGTFNIPKVSGAVPGWLVNSLVVIFELLWKVPYLRNNVAPPISSYTVGLVTHSATYNIDRAKKDLGYNADINLDEAINEYSQWVQSIGGIEAYLNKVP